MEKGGLLEQRTHLFAALGCSSLIRTEITTLPHDCQLHKFINSRFAMTVTAPLPVCSEKLSTVNQLCAHHTSHQGTNRKEGYKFRLSGNVCAHVCMI